MSVVPKVGRKAVQLFTRSLPKWPKIHLGRFLCRVTQAYASAVWTAYGTAIGVDANRLASHSNEDVHKELFPRDLEYQRFLAVADGVNCHINEENLDTPGIKDRIYHRADDSLL